MKRLAPFLMILAVAGLLFTASISHTLPLVGFSLATVFTNAGKAITTNRILGAGTEPKFVAWGTAAGTAAVTDTTLFTEAAEARTSGASSRVTTTVTNDTYQVIGTITSLSNQSITNAGLFDAAAVGNLYLKGDFAAVPLSTGEGIQFTMQLKYA